MAVYAALRQALRHGVGARRTDKALVTPAEIDAAAVAYLRVGKGENIQAGMLAILEAAAQVRPKRKDNTRAAPGQGRSPTTPPARL